MSELFSAIDRIYGDALRKLHLRVRRTRRENYAPFARGDSVRNDKGADGNTTGETFNFPVRIAGRFVRKTNVFHCETKNLTGCRLYPQGEYGIESEAILLLPRSEEKRLIDEKRKEVRMKAFRWLFWSGVLLLTVYSVFL